MGHVLNCFFGWNCGLHSRRAQIDQVRYPGHAVHFTNLDYDAYRERVEALANLNDHEDWESDEAWTTYRP